MKTILILGSGSGVGKATANLLSNENWRVLKTSSSDSEGALKLDLSSSLSVDNFLGHWQNNDLGVPDVILFNAGVGEIQSVEYASEKSARRMFEINFWGHYRIIQHFIPKFRQQKRGQLIFMGSIVKHIHFPYKAHYCASKSALGALATSLYFELAPYGIKVNLIEPGWIQSKFHKRLQIGDPKDSPYFDSMQHYADHSKDEAPRVLTSEKLAKLIFQIINKPKKFRYLVGTDAKFVALLMKLLPYNFIMRLLKRFLQNKQKVSR